MSDSKTHAGRHRPGWLLKATVFFIISVLIVCNILSIMSLAGEGGAKRLTKEGRAQRSELQRVYRYMHTAVPPVPKNTVRTGCVGIRLDGSDVGRSLLKFAAAYSYAQVHAMRLNYDITNNIVGGTDIESGLVLDTILPREDWICARSFRKNDFGARLYVDTDESSAYQTLPDPPAASPDNHDTVTVELRGPFLSWKYFAHGRVPFLRSVWKQFRSAKVRDTASLYEPLDFPSECCAVELTRVMVRKGRIEDGAAGTSVCPYRYVERAIADAVRQRDEMCADQTERIPIGFIVCTYDKNAADAWIHTRLRPLASHCDQFLVCETPDTVAGDIHRLCVMSNCRHHIVSPASLLGWWAVHFAQIVVDESASVEYFGPIEIVSDTWQPNPDVYTPYQLVL